MKKILLLILTLTLAFQGFSQEVKKSKKGYVSVGLGYTIYLGSEFGPLVTVPVGSTNNPSMPETLSLKAGNMGLVLNLIDAGYTFGKNWGVSLRWQGGAHIMKNDKEEFAVGFGALTIGPMYTIELNEELVLDFKIRGGILTFNDEYERSNNGSFSKSESIYGNFGIELGTSLRYHFAPKWSWINNLEYQHQFSEYQDLKIHRINVSTGIGFRF